MRLTNLDYNGFILDKNATMIIYMQPIYRPSYKSRKYRNIENLCSTQKLTNIVSGRVINIYILQFVKLSRELKFLSL